MSNERSTSPPALLLLVLDDLLARLGSRTNDDWSARAGSLTWTVTQTVDHLIDVFTWYAVQLATGAARHTPVDAGPPAGATSEDRLRAAAATGQLLVTVVEAVPDDRRAWHWTGIATPEDFAVMAMAETLVHGYDIHAGLGQTWQPDTQAARIALTHLFPRVTLDEDPWTLLLWAHGRADLSGRAPA